MAMHYLVAIRYFIMAMCCRGCALFSHGHVLSCGHVLCRSFALLSYGHVLSPCIILWSCVSCHPALSCEHVLFCCYVISWRCVMSWLCLIVLWSRVVAMHYLVIMCYLVIMHYLVSVLFCGDVISWPLYCVTMHAAMPRIYLFFIFLWSLILWPRIKFFMECHLMGSVETKQMFFFCFFDGRNLLFWVMTVRLFLFVFTNHIF